MAIVLGVGRRHGAMQLPVPMHLGAIMAVGGVLLSRCCTAHGAVGVRRGLNCVL